MWCSLFTSPPPLSTKIVCMSYVELRLTRCRIFEDTSQHSHNKFLAFLFLETCYTCTVLPCTGGVTTPKCNVLRNQRLSESANGRFKPGTFFVSSIILRAKHELTSEAASKSILLRLLQVEPAIIAKDR